MPRKNKNYKYLIRLYSLVDDYLANGREQYDNFPEVIISFCVVVEKILKIKLYKENPVLVFDSSRFRDSNTLITIIKKKEVDIETIRFSEVINRYKLLFSKKFSDDEIQAILNIYEKRNHFIHSYKSDDAIFEEKENIEKMMGAVWEKISDLVITIFGKDAIKANKPKTKYTEKELEMVLEEEVKKKIEGQDYRSSISFITPFTGEYVARVPDDFSGQFFSRAELCPRCNSYSLSMDNYQPNSVAVPSASVINQYLYHKPSDLYRCSKCNLELTRKEYEIAKKLKDIK